MKHLRDLSCLTEHDDDLVTIKVKDLRYLYFAAQQLHDVYIITNASESQQIKREIKAITYEETKTKI